MKNHISIALLGFIMLIGTATQAQKVVTDTLWVGGVCGMCEERIAKAVDTKGVLNSDYDLHEHQLVVTYNRKKTSLEQISQRLNDVGHDTNLSKADDEVYEQIHACCKYREHKHNHDDDQDH